LPPFLVIVPNEEKIVQPSDAAPGDASAKRDESGENRRLQQTLVWIGVGMSVAGLGAAVAYSVARAIVGARRPDDPTSQRVQQLIDEANSLLKALDDQRHNS
jgi:hypothetical protein